MILKINEAREKVDLEPLKHYVLRHGSLIFTIQGTESEVDEAREYLGQGYFIDEETEIPID